VDTKKQLSGTIVKSPATYTWRQKKNRRSIPPLDNRICTNYEKPAGMFLLSLVTLITLNFSPILFVETK